MKNTQPQKVIVMTKIGSDLVECMQKAINMAVRNKCAIGFTFNGKIYRVNFSGLLDMIEKEDNCLNLFDVERETK